ncbi:MAG: glutamate-1-semialdehyde 2,1-aminomutase [Clostridiales Family XIII bacterium]|jgi:glutamate-1-semialdehyde 2,1-aminomutase|nr:glutamate-1-semialdehyde 2,1-aminomutase [Clostridiales Family XIII bacterium]
MGKTDKSRALYARAQEVIPGGVNSPARAFGAVGMEPLFLERAEGARVTDADGNSYIDFIGSWGPMILGHARAEVLAAAGEAAAKGMSFGAATELEVQMAELVRALVPSMELTRMVNSGTEATMSALRAARGFTGRDKIIKFSGCYHGHVDALLVKAGSGLLAGASPDSAGVSASCAADTLIASYNDADSVRALLKEHPGEVAAVIVEPVAANMGVVPPEPGFLETLRALCDGDGALLIFDEVITGFRLAPGGAQERYGIRPDLSTFGKILGGGLPVGAYGGRKDVMEVVAPLGPVYQAGTLSGNPVSMAAGMKQLLLLKEDPGIYAHIEALGARLFGGLTQIARRAGAGCCVNAVGSIGSLFFTDGPVRDFASAMRSDTGRYARWFAHMLGAGILLAPAQFEAAFLSAAHTEADVDAVLAAAEDFFAGKE